MGVGIILLFAVTRLYNLLAVPIFTDEAIYIRWTQIFIADKHQFFISLTDGKQPLFIWLGYPLVRFLHDPLLGLRLVSVIAGLCSLIGIYFLTKELFKNKKTAYVAALVYIIYPFSLVYDKLALYDSLLATFAIWSLYAEVLLVRRRKFGIALLTGGIFAGGMLTKSSSFFFLYLLPFSLLLFDFKEKLWKKNLMKWVAFAVVAVALAVMCYSVLRLSPNYHYIADKNYLFVDPPKVWIKHPFLHASSNLRFLTEDLISYATWPLLMLSITSFFLDRKFLREKLLLIVWFAAPFSALVLLGSPVFLFPRYILFMTMPLLVLAAFAIAAIYRLIKPKYIGVAITAALLLPIAYKDYFILFDFPKAPIAKLDREQLIAGYASGVGIRQITDYLNDKSKAGPIYVGTEGDFGLLPQGIQDYMFGNKNVTIAGYWPVGESPPPQATNAARTMPAYFIFYAPCPSCMQTGFAPPGWPLKKIMQFKKIDMDTYTTLYQLMPQYNQ